MTGPSAHLSWDELACHDAARTPYPAEWRADRAIELAAVFEVIRAQYQQPIIVLSAYRTPAYNRRIGGATRSQHCEGRALDLRPPRGVSVIALHQRIAQLHAAGQIRLGGLGLYPTFVHVDTRPATRVAGGLQRWTGARPAAEPQHA